MDRLRRRSYMMVQKPPGEPGVRNFCQQGPLTTLCSVGWKGEGTGAGDEKEDRQGKKGRNRVRGGEKRECEREERGDEERGDKEKGRRRRIREYMNIPRSSSYLGVSLPVAGVVVMITLVAVAVEGGILFE